MGFIQQKNQYDAVADEVIQIGYDHLFSTMSYSIFPLVPPLSFYFQKKSQMTFSYLWNIMDEYFRSIILQKTGASSLFEKEVIQELWSGYGKIIRVGLENAAVESVVVKHVQLPDCLSEKTFSIGFPIIKVKAMKIKIIAAAG